MSLERTGCVGATHQRSTQHLLCQRGRVRGLHDVHAAFQPVGEVAQAAPARQDLRLHHHLPQCPQLSLLRHMQRSPGRAHPDRVCNMATTCRSARSRACLHHSLQGVVTQTAPARQVFHFKRNLPLSPEQSMSLTVR